MKKTDLKNGMSYCTRNNVKHYIINNLIYGERDANLVQEVDDYERFIQYHYDDKLLCSFDKNDDIVAICDVDGKQIWSRVDWSKVPVDTKVLVRDSDNAKWTKRHYACFDKEKDLFRAFTDGGTSWTTKDTTGWIQCKLDSEEDNKEKLEQKEISAYDLDKEFGEFCQKSFPDCRNCKYDMDNLCKIKWILDTYNLTKK